MAPARALIPRTRPPAMGARVLASVVPEPLIAVAPRVEPLGRVAVAPPTLPLPVGTPPVSPPMLPDGVLFVVIPVLGIVLPVLTSVVGVLLVVTPELGPVLSVFCWTLSVLFVVMPALVPVLAVLCSTLSVLLVVIAELVLV